MRALALAFSILLAGQSAPAWAAAPSVNDVQSANLTIRSAVSDDALPRLSDEATSPVVQTAFDVRVFDRVDWKDMMRALDLCNAGGMSLKRYMTPKGLVESKGFDVNSKTAQEALYAHGLKYHDEQALAMNFTIECQSQMIARAFGPFWSALPQKDRTAVRREGVAQVQRGYAGVINGALLILSEPLFTPANKEMVVSALERNAAAFGAAAGPAERAQIARTVASVDGFLPADIRSRVRKVGETIAATPCGVLCS